MVKQAARERYGWLDVMKLIAIWLMYTTHYDGMGRYGLVGLYTLLGILFFASGFTVFVREEQDFLPFLKEKFLRLMVPYFLFGLLALAVRVFLFELTIGDMIDWVKRLAWGARNVCPLAAMWFLPCLFFMELYHHLARRVFRNRWLVLGIAAAVSAAVKLIHEGAVLPWGIDMAGRFWIYYAIGDTASWIWRRQRAAGTAPGLPVKAVLAAGVIGACYVLYVNFYYGLNYFPSLLGIAEPSYPVQSLLTFLYECSGIVCALCAGLVLQKIPLLCRMGQMTLVLCGTEQIIKIVLPMLLAAVGIAMPDSGTAVGGNVMALQAMLMIAAAYAAFAVPIRRYFPWMLGRFGEKQISEKEQRR